MSPVLWYFRIGKAEIRNSRLGAGGRLFCAAVEQCFRAGTQPDLIVAFG